MPITSRQGYLSPSATGHRRIGARAWARSAVEHDQHLARFAVFLRPSVWGVAAPSMQRLSRTRSGWLGDAPRHWRCWKILEDVGRPEIANIRLTVVCWLSADYSPRVGNGRAIRPEDEKLATRRCTSRT